MTGGLAECQLHGEVFRDVNVPSKAFGELVEAIRHTPLLSVEEVKAILDTRADVVVLDARRFEEYRAMSIPHRISVPGDELAQRVHDIAPAPDTLVIANCAGRTRSIIGAQSLVNVGFPTRLSPCATAQSAGRSRARTRVWTLGSLRKSHPFGARGRRGAKPNCGRLLRPCHRTVGKSSGHPSYEEAVPLSSPRHRRERGLK